MSRLNHVFRRPARATSAVATSIARFGIDQSGATATLFALSGLVVIICVGAAVDYGRVQVAKARFQTASDAAVLAAAARPTLTKSQREALALQVASATLGAYGAGMDINVVETEPSNGVFQVKISAKLSTTFMAAAGLKEIPFSTSSEAKTVGISTPTEMALALDNTGSMVNDMPALRQAAKSLVQTVMGAGANGNVRVSVVPYVATVNPGLTNLGMVDTTAQAPLAGIWFTGSWFAYNTGCVQNWGSGGGGSGPGGSSSGDDHGDARDIFDVLKTVRKLATNLFGISSAHAADVTPNTVPTVNTFDWRSPATNKNYKIPVGYPNGIQKGSGTTTGGCEWLANPDRVNPYELFGRTLDDKGKAVEWKGCVEARLSKTELKWMNDNWGASYSLTKDYDVTDTPPSATDAASLFVPYFAPDEGDYSTKTWAYVAPGAYVSGTGGFHNNYLADGAPPAAWGWTLNGWAGGMNLLKYNKTTRAAIISETAPTTYGPNAYCPDPVLRLTNNQGHVISKIEGLNFWYNGGTIISEGLMWAWRTLSPNAPYADGAAYNSTGVNKVIVLMTDGVNGLSDNGNSSSANLSDFSAYGYLGGPRLSQVNGVSTYAGLSTLLDNRLLAACANAKAAGVKIYTVMFNHTGFLSAADQNRSTALLQQCATKPAYSFLATDTASLTASFDSIATSVASASLRLTK